MDIPRIGKNDNRETKPSSTIMINKKNFNEYKNLQLVYDNIKIRRNKSTGDKTHKSKPYSEVVEGILDIAVVVDKQCSDDLPTAKKKKRDSSSPSRAKKEEEDYCYAN